MVYVTGGEATARDVDTFSKRELRAVVRHLRHENGRLGRERGQAYELLNAPNGQAERLSKEVNDLQQELRDTRAFLFLRAKDRAYGKFSKADVEEAYERTKSRSVARSFDEHTGVTTFEFPAVRHEDPAVEKKSGLNPHAHVRYMEDLRQSLQPRFWAPTGSAT